MEKSKQLIKPRLAQTKIELAGTKDKLTKTEHELAIAQEGQSGGTSFRTDRSTRSSASAAATGCSPPTSLPMRLRHASDDAPVIPMEVHHDGDLIIW